MGRRYSDETKAAVLAALLAGQAVSQVAKDYDVPRGTVSAWKRRELGESGATVATQKKEAIGDLVVAYLEQTLRTLHKQAEVFGDEAWLKRQHASDAAVLHGVQTDKAIRLLEALGRASDD